MTTGAGAAGPRVPARVVLGAALGLLLAAGPGAATTVRVPLTVDYEMLARVVALRLGARPDGAAGEELDETCASLRVRDVVARPVRGRVEIRAAGRGRVGLPVFRWCFLPLGMEGELRIRGTPVLDGDWRLRLVDVEAVVVNREGESTFVTRRVTRAAAPRVTWAVEGMRIDLGPPIDETRALIRDVLTGEDRATALAIVESLRPGGVEVTREGVRVTILLDVPPPRPELVGPPAPLTPEEAARWREALERWDGFVVFVVKRLGLGQTDDEVLRGLFEVFLAARYDLAAAIEQQPVRGEDPVRRLFRRSWTAVRRVVRRAATTGPPDERVLRYVAFLTAGDALAALDEAAPSLGIAISADGLRRLARAIDPTALDPLVGTGDRVDPELQRLLGFHEPDTPPPPSETAPPPSTAPPSTAPLAPPSTARPARHSGLGGPLARVAHAAGPAAAPSALAALAPALDRWVPDPAAPGEIARYRDLVSRVLDGTAAREGASSAIEGGERVVYRRLVRTAAWQESCWRHFLRAGGDVTVLRSPAGDLGLMQVNRYVWRGVFDVHRLEWDILYNASAGAQILAQLFVRYGRAEAAKPGGHAARAAYSAYQGGPRAHHRYRTRSGATAYTRRVDDAFWRKYQVTERGAELRHVPCGSFEA